MNSPIAIPAPTGNTNSSTRTETPSSSPPPSSSNNSNFPTGQSEPSSLSSDNINNSNIISCKHEPSSSAIIGNNNKYSNTKHEADTSNSPVFDVAAAHHPNSSDQAQDTTATAPGTTTLAQSTRVESDHNQQQHEPQPDISEHAPEAIAVLACDDSASTIPSSFNSLPSSSSIEVLTVEAVAEQPLAVPIKPDHNQPSSLTSSGTTATAASTTTTWMINEEEGESEKGGGSAAERKFSQTSRSIFDGSTISTTASEIGSKPTLPTMAMPMPIPLSSSRLSPLDGASTGADSGIFVPSSSSASSSSSLSDYLIIGQEHVERDDSECDQRSEQSYTSSRDSYGERYAEDLMYDDASQDSHSESHSPASSSPPSSSPSRRDTPRRRTSRPSRRSPRPFDNKEEEEDEGERSHLPRTFSEGYAPVLEQQQRITESTTRSSVRIENEEEEEIPMSSSRPQSRSSTNKTYKRRSHKTTNFSRSEQSVDSPLAAAPAATLPVFKLPTIRGLTKSIVELMVASVVCISLISCMFALSYVSTGANHALGWYSDQQIGQRIRDGLKKREHLLQETLEKLAGEEYVKVKRQSRQYHQHHHQQQQQQHQARPGSPSPPYGPGGSAYYQNRYQQQHQQQREQRQQQQQHQQQQHQQQQQKTYQDDPDRGRLSTAEWQELIRAAGVSFMAKWTTATPNPWTSRR
ncbi:hypothetical protein BGZ96_010404 [Linnemannia gamsii]|uniref:Uncharacterized protein n=1 Tax=Linnemannia gamsii TaxID=64522 RepID=A0ABQ7KD17_9FUNG|nr:hypothetical protein BGZ96_010404 [Linnemannia gamsii]